MFMFASCPHCKLAIKCIDDLKAAHPEYAGVPFEMIDERKQPDVAEKYDYYYVPTFYVGEEKVHEGHAEMADVEKVFQAALA
jgi:glutaredoxin